MITLHLFLILLLTSNYCRDNELDVSHRFASCVLNKKMKSEKYSCKNIILVDGLLFATRRNRLGENVFILHIVFCKTVYLNTRNYESVNLSFLKNVQINHIILTIFYKIHNMLIHGCRGHTQ